MDVNQNGSQTTIRCHITQALPASSRSFAYVVMAVRKFVYDYGGKNNANGFNDVRYYGGNVVKVMQGEGKEKKWITI